MVASAKHTLHCHIEGVGAIESEYESLGGGAVKKLIQPMPAIIERLLSRERHLVPASPGICQRCPRELIHCAVDRLRLRKTRRGIVEVDHAQIILMPIGGVPMNEALSAQHTSRIASGLCRCRSCP